MDLFYPHLFSTLKCKLNAKIKIRVFVANQLQNLYLYYVTFYSSKRYHLTIGN